MSGSSFGHLLRITTFGESHGAAVGVVIDGLPPGLEISEAEVQVQMDRRKPGQSDLTTPRKEADKVAFLSGVFEGRTTGTPMAMMLRNTNVRSVDYGDIVDKYRPGHADYTYEQKYGFRDWRGSGRASGRETSARVAAGAV
ncbi:MAG: chorismate synthase, partial [Spirochaetaceae bacterium]|nr:chorismate synthase [Spirochaetaceae bacterium]